MAWQQRQQQVGVRRSCVTRYMTAAMLDLDAVQAHVSGVIHFISCDSCGVWIQVKILIVDG
jgi:hypothetical protein